VRRELLRRDGFAEAGNLLMETVLVPASASGHGREYSTIHLTMQFMAQPRLRRQR